MPKSILVCCWRADHPVRNLGEWLIEPILARLGYGVRYYPHERMEPGEPCLLVIGSEFHRLQVDRLLADCREVWVWGQGNGYCREWAVDPAAAPYAGRVKVCALRGPITAEQSRVTDVPLCDPGFLAGSWKLEVRRWKLEVGDALARSATGRASVFPPANSELPTPISDLPTPNSPVLYIPHWEERAGAEGRLAALGADAVVDVLMPRAEVEPTLRRLARARFVLTSTLHTMILCLAWRVPCALCLPPDRKAPNMPQKWRDVFATLGAPPPEPVPGVAAGTAWWEAVGRKLTLPDTQPLLDHFPHHLAQPTTGNRKPA